MTTNEEYYASAMERVKVARELRITLVRSCPSGRSYPEAARANVGARAALRTACDIIEQAGAFPVPPYIEGHWAGLIEAAMKIISAVETEMYDPRAYPERYEVKAQALDTESGSD